MSLSAKPFGKFKGQMVKVQNENTAREQTLKRVLDKKKDSKKEDK